MERGGEIRSADTEENTYGLTDFCLEWLLGSQASHRAVEDKIFRILVEQGGHVFRQVTGRTKGFVSIDFALHYIELSINRGQATFGLNQNHAIHAVGDMFSDHWRCTVIDKEAGDQGFESKNSLFSRHGSAIDCSTARTRRGMEIN